MRRKKLRSYVSMLLAYALIIFCGIGVLNEHVDAEEITILQSSDGTTGTVIELHDFTLYNDTRGTTGLIQSLGPLTRYQFRDRTGQVLDGTLYGPTTASAPQQIIPFIPLAPPLHPGHVPYNRLPIDDLLPDTP